MMEMMQNWARTLSRDNKGAMCAMLWVFAHTPGWSPGEFTLPDSITHVQWMRLLFELSSFWSRQARSSIPYTKLSSSVFHGVLYASFEYGQFFTWYQVWALLDSGASYPFGPFVKVLHHSGWCTASYIALRSCLSSSSSVHKTPWDYPKTNVHCWRYAVDKRSSEPCLANCQAVFSWQEVSWNMLHIFCAMAFCMVILIWMLIWSHQLMLHHLIFLRIVPLALAPSPTSSPMMDKGSWL